MGRTADARTAPRASEVRPEGIRWARLRGWRRAQPLRQAREARLDERALRQAKEKETQAKMKAAGIEIDAVADKAAFQKAIKLVWDKYGAKYVGLIKQIEAVN
jgi:TRAP-type C4-dicarboxylate transport system substrate-binding protein